MTQRRKTTFKRTLSVLLSVLMLLSACAVAFPAAFAGLTVDGSLPTFTFYVPETIYLKPANNNNNKDFQYYINRETNGTLKNTQDTSGMIYFSCSSASSVTGLSMSGGTVTFSATTSNSGTLNATASSGTLSSAISMNATTQISWTVTFTCDGESYSATAYTQCYAPNRNVTANGVYGHSSYKDVEPYASSLIFIQGAQGTGTAAYTDNDPSSPGRVVAYQKTNYNDRALDPLVNGITAPDNNRPSGYSTGTVPFDGATQSFLGCNCIVDRSGGYGSDTNWITHWDYNKTSAEITVDKSRYSNISQIPNLKLGFIVTDWADCNGRKNYFVSDCTSEVDCTGDTPKLWTSDDTGYTGGKRDMFTHAYWQKDKMAYASYTYAYGTVLKASGNGLSLGDEANSESCGIKYQDAINYVTSGLPAGDSTTLFFRGGCSGRSSDSGYAISLVAVSLKVTAVDKANLRSLVDACVGQYMDGYYTTSTWNTYNSALQSACATLGNPAASQSTIDSAYSTLNTAKNGLVRATGTATVTHVNAAGTKTLGTDTEGYNYGETVTASANSYNGYTYTSANPTTLSFNNVKSDTKDWTLTYTPTDYTITYNTDGGNAITAKTYNIESTDTLPSASKTGHTFNHWTVTSNTNGSWSKNATVNAGTSLTGKYGDATLKADYTIHSSTLRVFPYPGTWQGTDEWTAIDRDYGEDYTPGNPTPPTGYHFTGWTLKSSDDEAEPNGTFENGTYLFGPADGALDILEANYEINNYAVTLNSDGTGYTVTTAPAANANHGSDVTFAITLDAGYSNSEFPACTATNAGTVTSSQSGNVITYTVPNVTGATTISLGGATINTYNVTVTAGTGTTITGIEAGSYNHGTTFTVIAAATQGYDQSTPVLKVNGTPITSGDTITLTGDIAVTTDDLSLNTYNVTFTPAVDGGYAVATAPAATVTHGGSVTFAITLDTPYTQATPTATATVGSVTPNKDGAQVTYTVTDITADTTITVDAAAINTYPVAFGTAENGGYAVTTAPAATVTHGGSVTFVLELDDSHSQATPTATATVGTVTPNKNGSVVTYTVSNITGGTEISVNAAAINEYTVCYYNENGDLIVGVPVQDGVVPTAPTAPEKAPDSAKHYTFAGWKANNAGDPIPTADLPAASSSSCKAYYAAYIGTAHTYTSAPAWGEWTEDETTVWTCVATFKCDDCANTTTPTVTVTPAVTDPTCTEDGYTTYSATASNDISTYTNETTKKIVAENTATGHHYTTAPTWGDWAEGENGWTCVATFKCDDCDNTITPAVTVTPAVTDPTCTEDGYTTYTASASNDTTTYTNETTKKVIAENTATDHHYTTAPTWGDWVEGENGWTCVATFKCDDCDNTITPTVTVTPAVTDPTCTEDGYTTYTASASNDTTTYTNETTKKVIAENTATDHHYTSAPTWGDWVEGENGWTCVATFKCDDCDNTITPTVTVTPAVTDPTCTEDGYTTYTASASNDTTTYTNETTKKVVAEGTATGHSYAVVNESEDILWTATEGGYSVSFRVVCSVCNDEQSATVTATLIEEQPAGHITDGFKKYTATATIDGTDFTAEHRDVLPAEGHSLTHHDAAASTVCTETGTVEYYSCSGCDVLFAADGETVLESLSDGVYGPHAWEWVTDTDATCGAAGVKHEECSVCHEKRNENTEIAATGEHTWEWVTDTDATCGAAGVKHEECSVCHAKRNENTVIPATGEHTGGEASCTARAICTVCGQPYGTLATHIFSILQSNEEGHWYKCQNCEAVTEKSAHTGTATCVAKAVCTVCEQEFGEVDLNNHATTETALVGVKAPGYTFKGYTGDRQCVACHEIVEYGQDIDKLTLDNNASMIKANEILADSVKYSVEDLAALNEKLDAVQAALEIENNDEAVLAAVTDLATFLATIHPSGPFTVAFWANGSLIDSQTVASGESAAEPAVEALLNNGENHSRFTGWDQDFTCVTNDMIVHAVYGAEESHNWVSGTTIKAATCVETGLKHVFCACGATGTAEIPVDPNYHTSSSEIRIENEVPATCTTEGSYDEVIYCLCGVENRRMHKTREKLPHTPGDPVQEPIAEATCTEAAGYYEVCTCTVCGQEVSRTKHDEGEALGHDWSEWNVTARETCTAEGSKNRTCARCGETETVTVEKAAHPDSNGDLVCDVCGAVLPGHAHKDDDSNNVCDSCGQIIDDGPRCSWCSLNDRWKGTVFVGWIISFIHIFIHLTQVGKLR